jgi:hypothetical protein
LSPKNPVNGWLWGIGPRARIPTASSATLGSNVWGGGVTGVLVKNADRAAHPKATRSAYGHSLLFRAQTSSFTRLKTAPKSRHSFVEVQRCRRFAVCSGFEIARMLEIGNERGLGRAPSEPQ